MRRLLLAACALLAAAPAYAQGTLNIGMREDPDLLDPTLGSSYVGRIVYAAMCDKLFDLDAKLNVVPQLAMGWEYESPTRLVIRLRPNVTFQDGEPFNAEAVRYKINRDLTLNGSMRVGEVNSIQAVEVIDPLTIRLVLKAPNAPLLTLLTDRAGIMISPKAAEAAGNQFGTRPVCAGPYAFDSRVAQDRITLRRYPGHWDAANYYFDQVVYRPMPSTNVRTANLRAGSLDLVEQITPNDVPEIRNDPKLRIMIGDGLAYTGINFNINNGPNSRTDIGQNRLVRQAFEASIDRTALIQVVYDGLHTPTIQANPPSSPMYFQELQPPPRDLARAKALLQQAGVKLPVPVTITTSNSPDIQQAAEVIQAMAAEAGFDVKLRVMEFASSLQAGYAGDFQAYMIGWSGRADADGNMWQLLHSRGTFNYGRWSNPEADALLDQARLPTDPAERRALYARFWEIERQDLPLMYLWSSKNVVGLKRSIEGFEQIPDGLIRLRGVKMAR
ncbi:ABC transporter substrate-binding protein [Roseomonas marmotae]|uniref:ABC transporter substrate-binding protein n=1 Tax=Roseomonas marmotae TaxID=2768161 RepID=A0ABS3KAK6_9PROT|nr:ABC transporter substrate-binding protein [Roseomonas marmotae]MBO1073683.1 ABC transporter substrate-binding protein [Roseomonas marmotae]QTI78675.1 ABC transporter substrate-binding protein [Roseomonas marmotae]